MKQKQEKNEILLKIHQQRLDLIKDLGICSEIMAPYDHGWLKIASTGKYVVLASGLLGFYVIRHPVRLFKSARRILEAWTFIRLIRRLF